MPRTVVIKGRVVGPHTVELETALPDRTREVEVVERIADRVEGRLSDYVRALPPGTRSKDDIDRQVREERDSWSLMRVYLDANPIIYSIEGVPEFRTAGAGLDREGRGRGRSRDHVSPFPPRMPRQAPSRREHGAARALRRVLRP